MRGITTAIFLAALMSPALAQEVDADQIIRMLNGAEARLKIDSLLFEGMTEIERVRAPDRDPAHFQKSYGDTYSAARAAAATMPDLIIALRQHQAKLRQCDQLLEWNAAQHESERLRMVDTCRSELAERRAMVDILLGEATGTSASAPR